MAYQTNNLIQGNKFTELVNSGVPFEEAKKRVTSIPVDTLNTTQNLINLPKLPVSTQVTMPTISTGINTSGQNLTEKQLTEQKTTSYDNLFKQYITGETPPPSITDEYTKARESAGITAKQEQVNLYTTQLNQINEEAKQAQLLLEQQAGGKDITTGFLGKQQQEISRQSAIKALPVSAQLNAAQGNLQTAQSNLETLFKIKSEDVTNQYNYLKEQRKAIMNYVTEQQKGILEKQQKIDDNNFKLQQDVNKYKQSLVKELIASGQTNLINELTQAKTDKEINDVASKIIVAKKTSDISNVQTDNERALMSQFRGEQIVKDYNEILGQKGTVDQYIKNGVGGPADLALVFSFMKGLDPNSVVRESEYATAAKSGNIFQGIYSKFNGYLKEKGGFLPPSVRQEFQNLVNLKLKAKETQYKNVKFQYEGIAKRQGLNEQNVIIDYASGGLQEENVIPENNKEALFLDVIKQKENNYFTNLFRALTGK